MLAIASWNEPSPALMAMEAVKVRDYFDFIVIEPHPYKERIIDQILRAAKLAPSETVFIDDNPHIIARVRTRFREIRIFQFGVDVDSFCELIDILLH